MKEQTNSVHYTSFPKEFELRFWDRIDRRFTAILFASLLIHATVIGSLLLNPPKPEASEGEIEKIQKRFAKLVQDQAVAAELPSKVEFEDASAPAAGAPAVEPVRKSQVTITPGRKRPAVGAARGAEKVAEIAPSASGSSGDASDIRAVAAEEVGGQGLLGLLTGDGPAEADAVEDILGSDGDGGDIGAALSGVAGTSTKRASGGSTTKSVRATRETGGGDIDEYVQGLGQSQQTDVSRSSEVKVAVESKKTLLEKEDDKPLLQGARDIDQVIAVVKSHNAAIQSCYQRALRRNPDLRGKMVVRFIISPGGTVSKATILSSTIKNEDVETCVLNRIRHWNDFGEIDRSKGDTAFRQVYTFGY